MQNRPPTLHRWCHAKSLILCERSRSGLRSLGFASLKGEARFVDRQSNRAPRGRPIDETCDVILPIHDHGASAAFVFGPLLPCLGAMARALAPRSSDRGTRSTSISERLVENVSVCSASMS